MAETAPTSKKTRDILWTAGDNFSRNLYPCAGYNLACYNHFIGVIIKDPDILGGTPVFRGTRVPIKTLFDYLEGGKRSKTFSRDFPLSRVNQPSLRSKKQNTSCLRVPKCAF